MAANITILVKSGQARIHQSGAGSLRQIGEFSRMANHIREIRTKLGWTLETLASRMETSTQQVQRLETGQRKLTEGWLLRLSTALGVPPTALLDIPPGGPDAGEFVNDRNEIALRRFWRGLSDDERTLFLKMLGAPDGKLDDAA